MAVKRYQDLVAWQLADELKNRIYALLETTGARADRDFCRQIRNAASSAPGNIAEGSVRTSTAKLLAMHGLREPH